LKETKNVSYGSRMGGPVNGNATIKINMREFVRRRIEHLVHTLLLSAVNSTWIS
jgi:hypothetical protein